jgi:predicted methyltransferase
MDAQSALLANQTDAHTIKVFDPVIKWRDRPLRRSIREAGSGEAKSAVAD